MSTGKAPSVITSGGTRWQRARRFALRTAVLCSIAYVCAYFFGAQRELVTRVSGSCRGTFYFNAMPTQLTPDFIRPSRIYAYDCASGKATVLASSVFSQLYAVGLAPDSNLMYFEELTGLSVRQKSIWKVGRERHSTLVYKNDDLDMHDVLVDPRDKSLIVILNELDHESLPGRNVRHQSTARISPDRKITEIWSSRGKFTDGYARAPSDDEIGWKSKVKTALAQRLAAAGVKLPLKLPLGLGTISYRTEDYFHQNAMEPTPSGDLLLSSRHQEALLLLDPRLGRVRYAIGRHQFSGIPTRDVTGDPWRIFGHQHSPRYLDDTTLAVFDNHNTDHPDESRVVLYEVPRDEGKPLAFLTQFVEPNKAYRPAMGSVAKLDPDRILVDWGAVRREDRDRPQRAISVINTKSGKEEFSLDLAPGYHSYRAVYSDAIAR